MILWISAYLIGVFITSLIFGFTYNQTQKITGWSVVELDSRIAIATIIWPIILGFIIIIALPKMIGRHLRKLYNDKM